MRVLITGAGSNLGRAAVPALAAAGHELRLMDFRPLAVEHELIEGDVRDPGVLGGREGRHLLPRQTLAAYNLCTGIPQERTHHHLPPGVGHYGVFCGSRWEAEGYSVVHGPIDRASERLAAPA